MITVPLDGVHMARRKSRKTPTKRRSRGFNLVDATQTYLQTAIITRAAFNTNPIEFVTGMQNLAGRTSTDSVEFGTSGYFYDQTTTTQASSGYLPILNGTALTLPEILGFDNAAGDSVPFGSGGLAAIRANIALNGGVIKPLMQTVGLNIGFAVGKRVFTKQRALLNKGAKMSGLASMVRF